MNQFKSMEEEIAAAEYVVNLFHTGGTEFVKSVVNALNGYGNALSGMKSAVEMRQRIDNLKRESQNTKGEVK